MISNSIYLNASMLNGSILYEYVVQPNFLGTKMQSIFQTILFIHFNFELKKILIFHDCSFFIYCIHITFSLNRLCCWCFFSTSCKFYNITMQYWVRLIECRNISNLIEWVRRNRVYCTKSMKNGNIFWAYFIVYEINQNIKKNDFIIGNIQR